MIVEIKIRSVLKAVQYLGTKESADEIIAFSNGSDNKVYLKDSLLYVNYYDDYTRDEDVMVAPGDWVVKYVTGDCGVVNPVEFNEGYEIV